jgi:hypothetical protein
MADFSALSAYWEFELSLPLMPSALVSFVLKGIVLDVAGKARR